MTIRTKKSVVQYDNLKKMKLEIENESPVQDPTVEDIEAGIQKVDGKQNGFAILSLDDMTYLQVAGGTSAGFLMEYQNGSLDEHYKTSEDVSAEKVIEAFKVFSQGETSWHDQFKWDKEELKQGSGCFPLIVIGTFLASSIKLTFILRG